MQNIALLKLNLHRIKNIKECFHTRVHLFQTMMSHFLDFSISNEYSNQQILHMPSKQ